MVDGDRGSWVSVYLYNNPQKSHMSILFSHTLAKANVVLDQKRGNTTIQCDGFASMIPARRAITTI